jgi:predicted signal transduction protein with EAL and GGDEF domain/DNA-binding response OmpR family regulator
VPVDGQLPVVLVVDDDAASRLMTRIALEDTGFEVLEADDGLPALDIFRRRRVDAVLLDVMMIELDGFATCTAIRQLPQGQHVPIMMMTGLEDTRSINAAYDAGATDFITKPINFEILTHRVRYMLRAARDADELRRSEARLAQAQAMAKLGHFNWHPDSGGFECSAEVTRLLGVEDGAVFASLAPLAARVDPDERRVLEDRFREALAGRGSFQTGCRVQLPDGPEAHVHLEVACLPAADGAGEVVAGVVQDVSERRLLEGRAYRLEFYDSLTGLPNRSTLRRDLAALLARATEGGVVAVCALDLDHFKRVNDTLGREHGDEVLEHVAERLQASLRRRESGFGPKAGVRAGDFVARTGADEFYVVLGEFRSAEESAVVARRLLEAVAQPLRVGGEDLVLSATMGIAVYPEDGLEADQLIERAEAAKNHGKVAGRGRYEFYTATINARASARLSLEINLRKALQLGQFELCFQPKVLIATGECTGAEAMVRWNHPELGPVPPSSFIPVAEETGLIVQLGEWIVAEACRTIAGWRSQGLGDLRVAVNISAAQFASGNLPALLAGAVDAARIPPALLEVELTESLLLEDSEQSIAMLAELRALGIDVWLDDFGTGYSSLSYLRRFPLAGLKIDQAFVREMDSNANDAAIVGAIIALARSLELAVVAEGVETALHLDALTALGCDYAQGYLLSRPLPAEQFAHWLLDRRGPLARAV